MTLPVNRREVILAGTMAALTPSGTRESESANSADGDERELWPGGVPGARSVSVTEEVVDLAPGSLPRDRVVQHVTRPVLHVFRPRANYIGVTLLVVPGGGYRRVVIDREGFDTAEWLVAHGFGAGVLRYRLPADGWEAGADAPVHDAMRAMRRLRAYPPGSLTTGRIGAIGFSAGGHVIARLITEPSLAYPRQDDADDQVAMPDFAVLVYPVIALAGEFAHPGSAQQVAAAGVSSEGLARLSAQHNVTSATPRTMLVHSGDDQTVPVENSLMMYDALRKAGVRSELHVFDRGGHGFGWRGIAGKDVAAWPRLLGSWAKSHA